MASGGYVNPLASSTRGKKSNQQTLEQVCEAAYAGDYAALETLLSTGNEDEIFNGDVNMFYTDITALHMAAMAGKTDCVKLLLKANADPHIRQCMPQGKEPKNGELARDKAAKFGHNDVVDILQKAEKDTPPGWYMPDGIANNRKLYKEPKPRKIQASQAEKKENKEEAEFDLYGEEPAKPTGPPLPVCLMFPGQGSQYVKMLNDTKDLPDVKDMLSKAKGILGYDLLQLCLEGPEDKLAETRYCQPAMFVGGLAGISKLRGQKPEAAERPQCMAGLSLGEYTALCAAGVFTFEDGLRLVKLRGEAMQEAASASKQLMLSVAGLDKDVLESLCKEAAASEKGGICQVANALFPKGFACAGSEEAVKKLMDLALAKGALQAKMLKTSGAFHTSLMQPAQEKLKQALEEILPKMKPPRCRVYMNVTGKPLEAGTDPKQMVELLGQQLVRPVLWEPTMKQMIKDGITEFYECGPQKQLKAMMKRIDQKVWNKTTSIEV